MICRDIEPNDYLTVSEWFASRDLPMPPEEVLPPTGAIVEGHAAGWVYISNGGIAQVEWVIGNKDANRIAVVRALNLVIPRLIEIAKENGNHRVYTSVNNESLIKILSSMGFTVCEDSMTNLLYF